MINFVLIYRDYPQNLDNWLGVAFGQGMVMEILIQLNRAFLDARIGCDTCA
jgi:hypothetical protein